MSKKLYKEITKRLPKDYEEIAFEVSSENRKLGLNKHEFNMIRDRVYEEVETLYNERIPAGDSLKKKVSHVNDKLAQKASKKTKIELVGSYFFIIFTILSVLFPLLYGLNFNRPEGAGVYSIGINMFISFNNMFLTVVYCTLGVVITAFVQNISKTQRKILLCSTLGIGATLGLTFYALEANFPDYRLKLNFAVVEVVCLLLAIGGYFLEDLVAKKHYLAKHEEALETKANEGKENKK